MNHIHSETQGLSQRRHQWVELGRLALLAAVFLTALYFYGSGLNNTVLFAVATGLCLVWVSAGPQSVVETYSRLPGFVPCALGLLAIICLLHLTTQISPSISFSYAWILAAGVIGAVVAFWLGAHKVLKVFTAIVFVFAAISVWDYLWEGRRAYAPMIDPNNYATLLYLAWVPWALRKLEVVHSRLSLLALAGMSSIVCLAILATESRFGLLVIVATIASCVWCCWRFNFSKMNLMALSLSLAIALVIFALNHGFAADVIADGVALGSVESQQSPNVRWLMIESAWQAMQAHGGIVGAGLGSFGVLYPIFRSPLDQETSGQFVHNDFVQFALEGGVLLLLPLLLLAVFVGWYLLKDMLIEKVFTRRLPYLLVLAFVLLHSAINFVFYILPLVLFVGVIIACLFSARQRVDLVPNQGAGARLKWSLYGVWLVVGVSLTLNVFWLGVDVMSQGVFGNQPHVPYSSTIREQPRTMQSFARFAQQANSRRSLPLVAEAQSLQNSIVGSQGSAEDLGLIIERIEQRYVDAISINPWQTKSFLSYAEFLLRYPERIGANIYADPHLLFARAVVLDKVSLPVVVDAMNFHLSSGSPVRAAEVALGLLQNCDWLLRRRGGGLTQFVSGVKGSGLIRRLKIDHAEVAQTLSAALDYCENDENQVKFRTDSQRPETWMLRWVMARNQTS